MKRHRFGAAARLPLAALLLASVAAAAGGPDERPPAVAGGFYPADRAQLAADVRGFLAQAKAPSGGRPVAIVAPHAGYAYCGRILADAWRQAAGQDYDLLVILGVNHRVPGLAGAVVWPAGAWRTPLGAVRVDEAAARALLAADPDCVVDAAAHAAEHSLEVQLPFAQVLFPKLPILPVMVADEDPAVCARLGRALAATLRGRRPLIVASSDLSHYPAARDAEDVDRATLSAIASLDSLVLARAIRGAMGRGVPGLATCACGEAPVRAAMIAAKALGANRGVVVDYANSAQAPGGDPGRVVGYGAIAFCADAPETARAASAPAPVPAPTGGHLGEADRRTLLTIARETIRAHFVGGGRPPRDKCSAPALSVQRGVFVTLKQNGELRGCIGHIPANLPLCFGVWQMASAAAFQDPRFPPLTREELDLVTIEISALTPPRAVSDPAEIVVGRDGVVLRKGDRSAVFLPQVAVEQGWDRDTLLTQLALKAGLPPDAWREGARFEVFQAEVFGEASPGAP